MQVWSILLPGYNFIVLLSYSNEKTAVSISLVIDYKINSCIPFRNTQEVLKSLLCVVCVLKVHATSSSDTARHTVLVERWINSSSSDRCLILKMNLFFFDFCDFLIAVIYFRGLAVNRENRENNMSAEISCFTVGVICALLAIDTD